MYSVERDNPEQLSTSKPDGDGCVWRRKSRVQFISGELAQMFLTRLRQILVQIPLVLSDDKTMMNHIKPQSLFHLYTHTYLTRKEV